MATLITLKIDLSKVDKERIYKAESGAKYLDCQFYLNEEADQYGNNGMITQSVSKEERAAKIRGNILGNAKMMVFGDAPATNKAPKSSQTSFVIDDDADDDLPF
jgi:hypothetical protein